MKTCYIYYILCKPTGKFYIGSTSRFYKKRFNEHKYALRHNKHANKHMLNSWNKYSEDSFEFGIIEKCSINNLHLIEEHYIKITKSYIKSIGFNKTYDTIAPSRGIKWTEDRKKQHSAKLKGRVSPMKGLKSNASKLNIKKAQEKTKKRVINLCTGEIFESVTSFCRKFNMCGNTFLKYVGSGKYFNGILFELYLENEKYELKPKKIKSKYHNSIAIKNVSTGEIFSSIKEAAISINANPDNMSRHLRKGNSTYKNYKWEKVKHV